MLLGTFEKSLGLWTIGMTAAAVAADAAGTAAAINAPGQQSAATMPILRVLLMSLTS